MLGFRMRIDQLDESKTEELLGDMCDDFLWDLVRSLHEMRPKHLSPAEIARFHKEICKYHEHGKDEVCAAGGLL